MKKEKIVFGDFQTPLVLCNNICELLISRGLSPNIIIEPTCGIGNFIISALNYFPNVKKIYGLEINRDYINEANKRINSEKVELINTNAFTFNYKELNIKHKNENILILGNPPWVTNSKISSLEGENLPSKSNFKKYKGFEAQTGKSNFDISEYILLELLNGLTSGNVDVALIIKNSVIKTLMYGLPRNIFSISSASQYKINAKKYFNAAVEASLIHLIIGKNKRLICDVYENLSSNIVTRSFGWHNDSFVSDLDLYNDIQLYDGKSPYVWRHGLKHDCSKVMELTQIDNKYYNRLGEEVDIEEDLIFPLVNGTDIAKNKISKKSVIVTQKKIGQNTEYIKDWLPKTYTYLLDHKEYFDKRKSVIYKNASLFSIFGIGDYSFKKYKIAISALHEVVKFKLLEPINEKTIMVDDTCYSLGFDSLDEATRVLEVLNSNESMKFFNAIVFKDAKRKFTKDILMRFEFNKSENAQLSLY